MRSPGSLVKIGATAAMLLLLTWFPQALRPMEGLWGVPQCWGQELGQAIQNLEVINSSHISVKQFLLMNQGNVAGINQSSNISSLQGTGISSVQQSTGFNNNQGSVVAVNLGSGKSFMDYSGDIKGDPNNLNITPNNDSMYKVAIADGAFCGGKGINCVSQMAGNSNNQFTSVRVNLGSGSSQDSSTTVAISGSTASLSNAQLSAVASREKPITNSQTSLDSYKTIATAEAFKGFCGVSNVSQVTGNLNAVLSDINVTIKPVQ